MNYLLLLRKYVLNRQFFLGAVLSAGFLSPYMWGANSMPEELAEILLQITTGVEINFSEVQETLQQESIHKYIKAVYDKK